MTAKVSALLGTSCHSERSEESAPWLDLSSRASQSHFLRALQIRQEHRLCFGTEIWIFDHRIQLVIDRDTKRIEIGRADADPASVDHAGLGVHHLALPLPKSHAIREESPVIPSGEQ